MLNRAVQVELLKHAGRAARERAREKPMRTVAMAREALVAKVRKGLEEHERLLAAAAKGYRELVVARLEEMLERARTGRRLVLTVDLVPPEDHRADYRAALVMLEHDVRGTIELDERDFQRLVLNQWSWSHVAHAVNTAYASGGVVRAGALAQENVQGAPFEHDLLPPAEN